MPPGGDGSGGGASAQGRGGPPAAWAALLELELEGFRRREAALLEGVTSESGGVTSGGASESKESGGGQTGGRGQTRGVLRDDPRLQRAMAALHRERSDRISLLLARAGADVPDASLSVLTRGMRRYLRVGGEGEGEGEGGEEEGGGMEGGGAASGAGSDALHGGAAAPPS